MAAAQILKRHKAQVSVCDRKPAHELQADIDRLNSLGIQVYAGEYPQVNKEKYDLLVASPGIALDIQPFSEASQAGIPIIGELELAYQLKNNKTKIFAISGTNGKTTTTSLLQQIFALDGQTSYYAGNIGIALTTLVDEVEDAVLVVEVSSFQLETAIDFRPWVCGLLNITPDHLDRHKSMARYIAAKEKMFSRQTEADYAVLNYEDRIIREIASRCPSRVFCFSAERVLQEGAFIEDGYLVIAVNEKKEKVCPIVNFRLRGRHNLENILCAAMMAYLGGARVQSIAHTLEEFKGVRHRMEEVVLGDGILYINDSKATNPESAIKALESFDRPIILIAGGRNKGSDFRQLALVISQKVKDLVLLGEAKQEIKQAVMDLKYPNIHEVEGFEEAVDTAHKLAHAGDVVLLSPACASWDMFPSYEHRGDLFCQLVMDIIKS